MALTCDRFVFTELDYPWRNSFVHKPSVICSSLFILVLAIVLPAVGFGQMPVPTPSPVPEYVRSHYTKYEYLVPMRDGVHLFTSVYVPKDASQKYPFLLTRTPYSVAPYGVDNYRSTLGPSDHFEKEGFIFVYQDARGRYMSEGVFEQVRPFKPEKHGPNDVDESTDTYDSIEWLLKNVPNNNGRVGMVGISQPGFHVAASLMDAHPALKAASEQACMGDTWLGDDFFHNGAFRLSYGFEYTALLESSK